MWKLSFGQEISFSAVEGKKHLRTIVGKNDSIIQLCFKLKEKTNVLNIVSAVQKTMVF